jgi:predicted metalloendopeptidase
MALDPADRDPSVDPGTDFYRFANGGWLEANPIPPGYGAWGSFEEISVRNEAIVHRVVEQAATDPVDDVHRMLGDYYAAAMDTAAIEAAGLDPIRPHLDLVDSIASVDDLYRILPDLHRDGFLLLWGQAVTVDHTDSTRNLLWVVPTGLGLPERASYLDESEAGEALRQAYVAHVAAQLVNLGEDPDVAAAHGASVLALETRLAEPQLKAEEQRDPSKVMHHHTLDEVDSMAPDLPLRRHLVALGLGDVAALNVQQPSYTQALAGVLADTDVEVLRAYARFHVVASAASTLPEVFDRTDFEFFGKVIGGQQEQKERYKRVIAALGSDMGEALGRVYVDETFAPEAKDRALAMVDAILAEMRHSLETREWMSDATRERGLAKLDGVGVKIGYPDTWRDWTGIGIARDSYALNRIRAARFEFEHEKAKLTKPVDPTEWEMPPHVVNAYYHPTRNEIVFPAGILQEPMFDAEADDALNFGGIGTVVAHEITHGFDDQGRQFDADGTLNDWWEADDGERFQALADQLAEQFDGYVAIDDVHVNGRLTLGENIADLGGISLASRAHARVSEGSPDIDGLTPAQRFFLANATIWRANTSEELARTLAQVDPHSPRALRVKGPFSNLDAFQEAWGIADDAPMMRPRAERIEIW